MHTNTTIGCDLCGILAAVASFRGSNKPDDVAFNVFLGEFFDELVEDLHAVSEKAFENAKEAREPYYSDPAIAIVPPGCTVDEAIDIMMEDMDIPYETEPEDDPPDDDITDIDPDADGVFVSVEIDWGPEDSQPPDRFKSARNFIGWIRSKLTARRPDPMPDDLESPF